MITALISATGSELMPAFYAMAAALVGTVSVAFMKETARKPLAGSRPRSRHRRRRPTWWRAGHPHRGSEAGPGHPDAYG